MDVPSVEAWASVCRGKRSQPPEEAWGLPKQTPAALAARGVDLTGHDAVDSAVRVLNANGSPDKPRAGPDRPGS
ncbi:hypothetical protein [Streptomyces sp. NPDC006012]|uniref:hypothetical protein n=1 Tax=Streptomyces sp. NPDC006012 TaxID=3364739 RepID=UPI0036B582BC